jgi:spermidine/putrescine transport system permease protein
MTSQSQTFDQIGYSSFGKRLFGLTTFLTFGFLYIPIFVLIIFSFNESRVLAFPLTDLSFKWYGVLFADSDILRSIKNSFVVAVGVIPLTLVIGTSLAFGINRFVFPGKRIIEQICLIPLIIPGLITGLSILLIANRINLGLSLFSVVIGHSIYLTPIVLTQVLARLRSFDRSIEEASMDLGANRWQTFFRVTLPNIKTAILGSSLLVFTLSFDEVPISFFLTGSDNTLPMHIWSMLREGVTPEINAIATITMSVSVLLIIASLRLLSRRDS